MPAISASSAGAAPSITESPMAVTRSSACGSDATTWGAAVGGVSSIAGAESAPVLLATSSCGSIDAATAAATATALGVASAVGASVGSAAAGVAALQVSMASTGRYAGRSGGFAAATDVLNSTTPAT